MVKLHKFLLMLTKVLVITMTIVVWFFPSNDDFRTINPFWTGTKDLSYNYPVSPIESLSDLPSSPHGSILILIPYIQFSPNELESISSFVTTGGTIILADDYGYGNQITEYLGLRARFSGQPLLDPLVNYKNRWFPQITHLGPSFLTTNPESLVFNNATALTEIETGDILAQSSTFSFLDLNDDQVWQKGEPTGPLPVISQHNVGSGQVVLISDPSLFINSMQRMGSNHNLIQNIADIATSNLLIDQSHLPPSNLSQTKDLLTLIRGYLITPLGTLLLVIVALTITLMPLWRERRGH